jgi:hypothetical protein
LTDPAASPAHDAALDDREQDQHRDAPACLAIRAVARPPTCLPGLADLPARPAGASPARRGRPVSMIATDSPEH